MPRSRNGLLFRAYRAVRHPETLLARRRLRGLDPLDAVRIECAGPAGGGPPPAPLIGDRVFRIAARKAFPYARTVVFAGRSDPLLHPGLCRMIRWARSYGAEAGVETDGLLLDEAAICALVAAGTDFVSVREAARAQPPSDRAARNLALLGRVEKALGASRPSLRPAIGPGPAARCIEIAWDGGVSPCGSLRSGRIETLTPRAILRLLGPPPGG